MIKLSTAIAKAHLSGVVRKEHCKEALKHMKFAIFQEEDTPVLPAAEEEVADVLASLGSKTSRKKKKKKKREDEAAKVTELVESERKTGDKVSYQQKKMVFRCVVENLRDMDTPMILLNDLWRIVQGIPGIRLMM